MNGIATQSHVEGGAAQRRISRAFVLIAMGHHERICLLPSSDAIFLIVGVKVNRPTVHFAIGPTLYSNAAQSELKKRRESSWPQPDIQRRLCRSGK
jgi:hypothetical protein